MDFKESLKEILYNHYNIKLASVNPIQGGWSALAYVITDNKNEQFLLKLYDKSRASTSKLTSRIDDYMPIVSWLDQNSKLADKIVKPLLNDRGSYKYEDEFYIYMISEYIEGNNLINKTFTEKQILLLADLISELHNYGEDIPLPTQNIKENFAIHFYDLLLKLVNSGSELKNDLYLQISPYIKEIVNRLNQLNSLSKKLRSMPLKYVLCHTDIHEGNLLQGRNGLSLIDWEGLKLAPPEADLFNLVNREWFNLFKKRYNNNYEINEKVLHFYQQRRIVEDIWEFVEQLQFDAIEGEERVISLNYLHKECETLIKTSAENLH